MFKFTVSHTDSKARVGILTTPHGDVETPVFMPVGTAASVKGVTPDHLKMCGARMVLSNTYHLLVRPGVQTVATLGGLHSMMGWNGPMLTDSGGYQVFSLAHLRQLDDNGVVFQSHVDGSQIELSPQSAVEAQALLGADVMMQLDECAPADATHDHVHQAVERSIAWARVCKDRWDSLDRRSNMGLPQALFAIQQGGVFTDLRERSAAEIVKLDLPGYAIGGLSVGEGHEAMSAVLDRVHDQFPAHKPRYLMGVGEPRDILAAVMRGVDMFDCVMPTRNARNAQAFTFSGRLRLRNSCHTQDPKPLEDTCDCYTCRNFSRGTLRHLFMAGEMLGPTLVTIHNLRFFARFMSAIRQAVVEGNLASMAQRWLAEMYKAGE